MGKWHLARHGQTSWNLEGRMQGRLDPPLAPAGHEQARRLAKRLNDFRLTAVYSSPLVRAAETARAVAAPSDTPIKFLPDLCETSHGKWDGLTMTEIQEQYPKEYQSFRSRQESFVPPGGESLAQITIRASAVVAAIKQNQKAEDNLLIVSHSGTLRALLLVLLDLPLSAYWLYRVTPCALSTVSISDNLSVVELWNDTSHLV